MNQRLFLLSLLSVSCLIGCSSDTSKSVSINDGKGNRVVVSGSGQNTRVSVSDGNSQVTSDGSNTVVVDKDGSKSTLTDHQDGSTSVDTKDGSGSIGGKTHVTESELGVPFYPGSTEKTGFDFKFNTSNGNTYSSMRVTDDDPAHVIEFYKSKLENPASALADGSGSLSGKLSSGATINVSALKKDGKTQVSVTSTSKGH